MSVFRRNHSDAKRAHTLQPSDARQEGFSAYDRGATLDENPHKSGSNAWYDWRNGWYDGCEADDDGYRGF